MTKTWEEIRDEVAGMLADGESLESIIGKLEEMKNEMAKAELIAVFDELKKPKPMTNEEWLCEQILHFTELSTEEKAKCLAEKIEYLSENLMEVNVNKIAWLRWLKEKHHE